MCTFLDIASPRERVRLAWSASLQMCSLRPRLCTQRDVAHIPGGRFTNTMLVYVWVGGKDPD